MRNKQTWIGQNKVNEVNAGSGAESQQHTKVSKIQEKLSDIN